MAYCRHCGAQIDDQAVVCPHCGVTQNSSSTPAQPPEVDNGGIGWGLLGCCIPIVGLILFLVWKDQKPRSAKAAGIGALVSVIIGVVWYILMIALGLSAALLS